MWTGRAELVELLEAITQGYPFEPVEENRTREVLSRRARFKDVELTLRAIPGDRHEPQPTLEFRFGFAGEDGSWPLRDDDLAENAPARKRQAKRWRSLIEQTRSLERLVENALKLAASEVATPQPPGENESPLMSLGYAPGSDWIDIYLRACRLLGQVLSTDWLADVDAKLAEFTLGRPPDQRVQLSRTVWQSGAGYLEGQWMRATDAVETDPDYTWQPPRQLPQDDPGTTVHRSFLKRALADCNVVRSHRRPSPREALALIDHDETQCVVSVTLDGDAVYLGFDAMLKQGWIGRDVPPSFDYEERIGLIDLTDPHRGDELGGRLRAMDQAWSSWAAVAKTAEAEVSGESALFRRGQCHQGQWPYFYVIAQALNGRKVTPQWIKNAGTRFSGWMSSSAGPRGSRAATLAALTAEEAVLSAGLTALAAQQGVIPTYPPHAFAKR